jgi:diguanylate cyclase (GGDEF)-like protein
MAFVVDRATGSLPFQHLYYLPIVFAGLRFGGSGGWVASLVAVVLYHVANPALLSLRHDFPDLVQVVLFVVIGALTGRLRDDAHRLQALAGTDDLTGLHNLRAFERRLREAVEAARGNGSPLSLLVLDLDGLKALNDAHGHLTGADAVRTVGGIIASHIPRAAFACRYGGDEFVVALPGLLSPAARHAATTILEVVRSTPPTLAGRPFPRATLSVSIGVACLTTVPPRARSGTNGDALGEALFRAADAALYDAKRAGRGRTCVAATSEGLPIA